MPGTFSIFRLLVYLTIRGVGSTIFVEFNYYFKCSSPKLCNLSGLTAFVDSAMLQPLVKRVEVRLDTALLHRTRKLALVRGDPRKQLRHQLDIALSGRLLRQEALSRKAVAHLVNLDLQAKQPGNRHIILRNLYDGVRRWFDISSGDVRLCSCFLARVFVRIPVKVLRKFLELTAVKEGVDRARVQLAVLEGNGSRG